MGFDRILGYHESFYRRNKSPLVLSSRRHVVSRLCSTLADPTGLKVYHPEQLGSGCRRYYLHLVSDRCITQLPLIS
jgi:hypothetical protein